MQRNIFNDPFFSNRDVFAEMDRMMRRTQMMSQQFAPSPLTRGVGIPIRDSSEDIGVRFPNISERMGTTVEELPFEEDEEAQLQKAMKESLSENLDEEHMEVDKDLEDALKASLQETQSLPRVELADEEEPTDLPTDLEELEKRELEEAIQASRKIQAVPTIEEIPLSEEEEELQTNRKLKQQQDQDFENSLQIDQEKERQKILQEEEEEEQQALQFSIELAKTKRMNDLSSRLSQEPDSSSNITQIAVRMPNGERLQRRFLATDKLQLLRDFVEWKCLEKNLPTEFTIASDFPRTVYHNLEITFQEANLLPRAAVTVTSI